MVKLATWNVNSIKARLPNVLAWVDGVAPDVLLLQETKCLAENFPALEFETRGYHCRVVGQKSYNGVALISKEPIADVIERLPGEPEDEQARYVEGTTFGLRVASLYLPNGNPATTEKYAYKLRWMTRLEAHAKDLLASDQAVLLGGDYNVCPTNQDVYDPEGWKDDALCKPESRAAFRRLLYLGLTEAWRALDDRPHVYSFWDYTGRAFESDNGLRIDHWLLSPQAADRLAACTIDKAPRAEPKASDHTPVVCEIAA
ncbi:MAG: exodeoxyribonuclease III [Pseudomonadota bacterium]